MKTPTTDFVKIGDMGGKKITMSFDENSLEFLQATLIDLYSDTTLAIIREYSTNAMDSHIAAGQTRPIEVSTPTALSPYFKVKDYGLGMDAEDIERTYSKYGASTKRETNDQVGMLGLGSKSALTYTNQFNVRAVKDGIVMLVSVSRAETGGAEMTILDESPTDEPNGVEIIIPSNSTRDIEDKCRSFFRFWSPGTVLINGKDPICPNLFHIDNTIKLFTDDNDSWRTRSYSYVVMGNVPYQINWAEVNSSGLGSLPYESIVAFVDIGEVNFTPNREQLMYTTQTKTTLRNIAKQYQENTILAIQKDIDSAPTHADALNKIYEWRKAFGRLNISDYKYKNQPLILSFGFDFYYRKASSYYSRYDYGRAASIDWQDINNLSTHIFVGFDGDKISSYRKAQLVKWAENKGFSIYDTFYICKEMPGSPWTDNVVRHDWQEVLDTKLNRAATSKKKTPSWSAYIKGDCKEVTSFDPSVELVYAGRVEVKNRFNLPALFPDSQVVLLNTNQINKFKTMFPSAKFYWDVLVDRVKTYLNGLTDEDKFAIDIDYRVTDKCSSLDSNKVDDPQLKKIITLSNNNNYKSSIMQKHEEMIKLGYKLNVLQRSKNQSEADIYLKKYPLLTGYRGGVLYFEHIYQYLNYTYNTFYKKEESK